jgi:hypothetical protein
MPEDDARRLFEAVWPEIQKTFTAGPDVLNAVLAERDALKRRMERAEAVLAEVRPFLCLFDDQVRAWQADVIARAAAVLRGEEG